jgi:hypothetical protein
MTEEMMESAESLLEDIEDYGESDGIEEIMAERRRRRRTPRTASGRTAYSPQPRGDHVTQAQLKDALDKVAAQIKTNTDAIRAVNEKTEAVAADQAKQLAAIRKEASERKKQDDAQRRDVNQKLQLLTLLPFISKPKTQQVKGLDDKPVEVLAADDDAFSALLPLLLVGGLGGGGLGGSGSDSGSDSSALLLALVLSNRD